MVMNIYNIVEEEEEEERRRRRSDNEGEEDVLGEQIKYNKYNYYYYICM